MKYYLIVGEASGDLHASCLMRELKLADNKAEFRFFGGDKMASVADGMVRNYRDLAYMGIMPVIKHLPTILGNMSFCKKDIVSWKPDVLILVDYPGFNLSVAKYIKKHTDIPIYYYISPKIWAWKEYRIKNIKRDIYKLFSILPFEKDFFEGKHHYPIEYVGNPTVKEVEDFKSSPSTLNSQLSTLNSKSYILLMPGSRKQEIKDNLPMMLEAVKAFPDYNYIIAAAPGIDEDYYKKFLPKELSSHLSSSTYFSSLPRSPLPVSPRGGFGVGFGFSPLSESLQPKDKVYSQSESGGRGQESGGRGFFFLSHATAALVTSGTATLETALFEVPQVVCYYTPMGKFISWCKKKILKVKYISLVNLILNKELVTELVADTMTIENMRNELQQVLPGGDRRQQVLNGYKEMKQRLGTDDAARNAATIIVNTINRK